MVKTSGSASTVLQKNEVISFHLSTNWTRTSNRHIAKFGRSSWKRNFHDFIAVSIATVSWIIITIFFNIPLYYQSSRCIIEFNETFVHYYYIHDFRIFNFQGTKCTTPRNCSDIRSNIIEPAFQISMCNDIWKLLTSLQKPLDKKNYDDIVLLPPSALGRNIEWNKQRSAARTIMKHITTCPFRNDIRWLLFMKNDRSWKNLEMFWCSAYHWC